MSSAAAIRHSQAPQPASPTASESAQAESSALSKEEHAARVNPRRERQPDAECDAPPSASVSSVVPPSPNGTAASAPEHRECVTPNVSPLAMRAIDDPADLDSDLSLIGDEIAGRGDTEGMFEVLLPDGRALGVVVRNAPGHVGFLLNPPPAGKLAQRIRDQKDKIERRLGRRLGKRAKVNVL